MKSDNIQYKNATIKSLRGDDEDNYIKMVEMEN